MFFLALDLFARKLLVDGRYFFFPFTGAFTLKRMPEVVLVAGSASAAVETFVFISSPETNWIHVVGVIRLNKHGRLGGVVCLCKWQYQLSSGRPCVFRSLGNDKEWIQVHRVWR